MSEQHQAECPFDTDPFEENGIDRQDLLPATYHYHQSNGYRKRRCVGDPSNDVAHFLSSELSLKGVEGMLKHLWFAGAKRPATQLHYHVALGREVAVTDRMDLHLMWNANGKIFIKPIPRYLLSTRFWADNLLCSEHCPCLYDPTTACNKSHERRIARGFLYTYVCLISSDSDFQIATEKHLLPRGPGQKPMSWQTWKTLARSIIRNHDPNQMHPRFRHGELRLSRINAINRFIHLSPFEAYFNSWNDYSSFFRDNLHWIAASTVWLVLVLTAMQVGLAAEPLQDNERFKKATYVFTLIAILGPVVFFGLVLLGAVYRLISDLPWLIWQAIGGKKSPGDSTPETTTDAATNA
ncbi:subtilisin-like serine protease [Trichoderma arundinaceum]|uniref:Subtilisin-like serine protease n=1 Tax=Trichoderma arundinaceum TaxID=490622 RepID=A0A395NU68_TRIAR|nr:subtilisin-like serine protease [Trichoderma arundinaceum]